MTFAEAIAIAILQGVTELFPISSLGHAVVLPALFAPNINLRSPEFLPFLVVLHLGTAIALLIYFWRDWWELFLGIFRGGDDAQGENRRRLLLLIIAATIPAGVVGFLFEKPLRALFAEPKAAAAFLIANGFLLAIGEVLRKRALNNEANTSAFARKPGKLSFTSAVAVGIWQCLAFFPGISRSGATMVGGLLAKLSHEQAARFSFLLATPIIFGAALHEVPKLMHTASLPQSTPLETIAAGGIAAGIAAYLSVAFLMRYFHRHDFAALIPFAVYCILFGAASFAFL
jgi:undecaprenyl-diphosphatase